jgi:Glycosyltransferase sugar-binding region containing DXD motif
MGAAASIPAGPGPPLIQFWDAAEPPADVAALLDSMARGNPGMRHLVFDRAGAEEFIAARFSAREAAAFRACAVPAMQADYFRYCAMLELGGAYVDADFRSVAPLRPLLAAADGTLFGRPQIPRGWPEDLFGDRPRVGPYRIVANSFFLFGAPGHPLLRLAVELATANVESRVAEDVAVATGPGIFTSIYLAGRLGSLDAFLEYAAGGVLEPSAGLFCEVAGSQERVAAALAGVRISPFEESRAAVVEAGGELAYKSTDVHWVNYRRSIFRDAAAP